MPSPALPDLEALLGALTVVQIPLRVPFRGLSVREVAIFSGPVGPGEFGAFLEYGDAEAANWLAGGIEAAWVGWPTEVRRSIAVNATVPAVAPDRVASVLATFPGCESVKVKVAEAGQCLADDVARVAEVRAVMGPNTWIRVDANGGWGLTQALESLRSLSRFGLEYAEQPCASVGELRELRTALAMMRIDLPIAADESIRKAEDPQLVARENAADLIVVKAAPLGGVRRALRIVDGCGLPAVVSSALDTSVGMAAGIALAGALPSLPYDCGLGTISLLAADVTRSPLAVVHGEVPVRSVSVNDALLAELAAPADRQLWWQERVRRCHDRAVAILAEEAP